MSFPQIVASVFRASMPRKFTDYDLHRQSWAPNYVDAQQLASELNAVPNTWDATANEQSRQQVQNILAAHALSNTIIGELRTYKISLWSTFELVETRCPFGWRPLGPFCVGLSVVPPYTECPIVRKRFDIGVGNKMLPADGRPGICEEAFETGVTFACPPGAVLHSLPLNNEFVCTRRHVSGPPSLENSCAAGYVYSEPEGCIAEQIVKPYPSCPEEYALTAFVYDEYAWYSRERLVCTKIVKTKGKIWCPRGYHVTFEEFPDVEIGAIVPNDETSAGAGLLREGMSAEFMSLIPGGLYDLLEIDPPDSVACFQVLVALGSSCNEKECQLQYDLRHELIDWGYKIQIDPDYVAHMGLMGGRDVWHSNSGIKKNWS